LKKIAAYWPNNGMGTAMYRAVGPLLDLRRDEVCDIVQAPINPQHMDWCSFAFYDIAFFSWPTFKGVEQIIHGFHAFGVPVWVDFDDDPWNIKDDNITKKSFGPDVLKLVENSCELADLISVSTEHLRQEVYGPRYGMDKVKVFPNALNTKMYSYIEKPRKKCILWRGASGHKQDIMTVMPAILKIQQEYPDWPWAMVGDPPKEIIEMMGKHPIVKIPHQHIQTFMNTLLETAAPIQIVPLQDDTFNKAKSNCSWLEATWAGSAVLAPEFLPEFCKPGITTYKDNDDFYEKLKGLIEASQADRTALVEKSRFEIKKNYALCEVNKERKKVILGSVR